MRIYPSLDKLNRGEILDLGGIRVKKSQGEIKPGDLYVAERNTGPKLLTCLSIHFVTWDDGSVNPSWVNPTTNDYSYDWGECVKVEEA